MNNAIKTIPAILTVLIVIVIVVIPITEIQKNNDLYVVVLAGQSNAAYRFADTDLVNNDVSAPIHNCYYYGTENEPVLYSSYTNVSDYNIYSMYDGEWKIGNIEPTLAKTIGDITDHDVLIINCGVSGASISQLIPNGDYNTWTKIIVEDAISKINRPYSKIGYVWVQGEADTNTPIDTYKLDFMKIDAYYQTLGFNKAFIIQTKGINSRLAQQQLANEHDNIYMTTQVTAEWSIYNGMINPTDTVHYTQAADNIIGVLCGKYIGDLYKNTDNYSELLKTVPLIMIAAIVVTIGMSICNFKKN